MPLPWPPNPLKLSNPLQTVTSSIDKIAWQECVSVNRSSYYRPTHLHYYQADKTQRQQDANSLTEAEWRSTGAVQR